MIQLSSLFNFLFKKFPKLIVSFVVEKSEAGTILQFLSLSLSLLFCNALLVVELAFLVVFPRVNLNKIIVFDSNLKFEFPLKCWVYFMMWTPLCGLK